MMSHSKETFIHAQADVDQGAVIGSGSKVWELARVRSGAKIGSKTIIGRGAYIDADVQIGANCKIQNNALIYSPAVIADGVFIGPGAILTNDLNPRAINETGTLKNSADWEVQRVEILFGASIGAGAICVAPIRIGSWALVGAGAVVVNDVPNFALVVGNPAKQIGWVGKAGSKLDKSKDEENKFVCPITKSEYLEESGKLRAQDEK
jgi:UDP-2-acetamido-3-amino-2,3-dideoxy-glucuronate N-acetyltransferase